MLRDGGGIPSPGVRHPENREQPKLAYLGMMLRSALVTPLTWESSEGPKEGTLQECLLSSLGTGVKTSPVPPEAVGALRIQVAHWLLGLDSIKKVHPENAKWDSRESMFGRPPRKEIAELDLDNSILMSQLYTSPCAHVVGGDP